MKSIEELDVRKIRQKLGMNQSDFWAQLGVTQSGGSRYESGRDIPRPVQALLRLVHVERIDIEKIRKDDYEVIEYLRSHKGELYKTLKKEAKAKKKEK
jgi:transcriptional regulator with XRE-family HTH domain